MRITLISCYELGRQPLGIAFPAAHLQAAGFDVESLDLAVEEFDPSVVGGADLVCISVPMLTATRLGVGAADRVREVNPAAHVCFYGLYSSLNADYLLDRCADSVIGGEFESPLVGLAKRLSEGRGELPAGVITRHGRGGSGRGGVYLERQRFRVPARDGLPPLERYARLDRGNGERDLVGAVEASRGCAHRCRHCPIPPVYEGRLRIVQEEVAVADIDQLVALGADHITFADPDFLNGVKHSLRIVRRMNERHPGLSFDFTAKIEHIVEQANVVAELGQLGCIFVVSAAESLSDTVLRHLDKGHSAEDVARAVRITRDAGIALRPSLVSFTPWTTLSDFIDVLDFVEENRLVYHVDPVQYSIRLLLPPGSWLLRLPEMQVHLGELEQENFTYAWRHPDPRLDRLHREVSQLVEEAADAGEDARETFEKIRARAYELAGRSQPHHRSGNGDGRRAPRLTESWFCCAEPTGSQCRSVTYSAAAAGGQA